MLKMLFVSFLEKSQIFRTAAAVEKAAAAAAVAGSSNGNQEPQRACAVCALVSACVCVESGWVCGRAEHTPHASHCAPVAIRLVLVG